MIEKELIEYSQNHDLSKVIVSIRRKPNFPSSKRDQRLSEKKLTLLRKQQRYLKQSAPE
jgi:hypothetical protein